MLTSNLLISAVVLAISIGLLGYLSMKNFPLWMGAVFCTFIIGIVTKQGPLGILAGTFSQRAAGMFQGLAVVYMCGSVFAYVMTASGCSDSIARFFVKVMGVNSAPYILMFAVMGLATAGISAFPFILAPIAFSLLKEANLPRAVATVVFCGAYSLVGFLIPGVPLTVNVALSNILGTTLFAGADIGIIMFVIGVVGNILYYRHMIKDYKRKGIGYTPTPLEGSGKALDKSTLPPFGMAVIPLIITLGGVFIFQLGLKWPSTETVIISQGLAIIFVFVFCGKNITENKIKMIGEGMAKSFPFLMICCTVAAFGGSIQEVAIFQRLTELLGKINMNPYVLTVLCMMLLAFLTAGAMPAMMIFVPSIGQTLIAQGANASIIHRLCMATGTTFDSMPWSPSLIINFNVMDVSLKEAYGRVAVVQIVLTSIYTIVGLAYVLIFH